MEKRGVNVSQTALIDVPAGMPIELNAATKFLYAHNPPCDVGAVQNPSSLFERRSEDDTAPGK